MKNRPYYNIIIPIILLSIALPLKSQSQVILNRTIVTDKGRAILYFDGIPEFRSSLSDDKKKVVISINSADAQEEARVVNSSGLIESVYAQTFDGDLTISVLLKEEAGYTIAPMPFSNSLIVEVFSWDKLSTAEDNYRSGLLALENNIYPTAQKYFEKAAKAGHVNSKALLGILKLKNSKLDSALLLLKEAEKGSSDIYDIFAAISQIYELNGDQKNANKYNTLFAGKTSLNDFPRLVVDYAGESDGLQEEPMSFLRAITDDEQEAATGIEQDTAKDTLSESKQFENLFKNDTARANKSANDTAEYSLFENGIDTLLTYAFSFIIGLAILIVYLFVRWRKKQMSLASKEDRQEFKKRLAEAREEVQLRKEYAARTKAEKEEKAGKLIDKTTESASGDFEKNSEQEKYMQAAKRSQIQSKNDEKSDKPGPVETEGRDTEILDNIGSIEEVDLTGGSNQLIEKKPAASARIEMALNLAEEQRKVKTKKLESLQSRPLPVVTDKLSDVAKKLGIEQGGLEIKMKVEKMLADKKSLSKLADKFSVDKNKSSGGT